MTALHSPAADRNKQPILEQLLRTLPPSGRALEIASGSGQHVAHFAAHMPGWRWQASDPSPQALASIAALWPEGPAPLQLDVQQLPWPLDGEPFDAIFCANMLHISPWASCPALMRGAAQHLAPAGQLIVYGPFVVPGQATAPSNEAFDADLRHRDPAWGLRSLADVGREAEAAGLRLQGVTAMPANNLTLEFRRTT
ncbi:DUF938 domain-containing protein [Pelomonas sp. KK5]|uniref:DUF938 domain-containing protein n=1 Tax=Pelomonas sp. KK5 TaxID=1855730 RepID=UPI00097BBB8E|nr:DUF938 domain-containing protein [Pelomonas sp. KK5]